MVRDLLAEARRQRTVSIQMFLDTSCAWIGEAVRILREHGFFLGGLMYGIISLVAPMLLGVIWRETFVPVGAAPLDIPALARQHVETWLGGMSAGAAG